MPVFAEGRFEHQIQNKAATSQWPVGFDFGVQLDYSCRKKSDPANAENRVSTLPGGTKFTSVLLVIILGLNQSLCLPKAELNTGVDCFVFGVQLGLRQTQALIKSKRIKFLN